MVSLGVAPAVEAGVGSVTGSKEPGLCGVGGRVLEKMNFVDAIIIIVIKVKLGDVEEPQAQVAEVGRGLGLLLTTFHQQVAVHFKLD